VPGGGKAHSGSWDTQPCSSNSSSCRWRLWVAPKGGGTHVCHSEGDWFWGICAKHLCGGTWCSVLHAWGLCVRMVLLHISYQDLKSPGSSGDQWEGVSGQHLLFQAMYATWALQRRSISSAFIRSGTPPRRLQCSASAAGQRVGRSEDLAGNAGPAAAPLCTSCLLHCVDRAQCIWMAMLCCGGSTHAA
jgi:hypothetical protein